MVFLHISLPSKRMMNTFTKMIRDNFPEEEHRFLYLGQLGEDDKELLDYGNSIEITSHHKQRFAEICKEFDNADIIIWHGFLFNTKHALLLYEPKYIKKSVWIMRGIDLYNWKKEGKGAKTIAVNHINRRIRENVPYIGAIFETDEPVYRNLFKGDAHCFFLPYPISESAFDEMEINRDSLPRKNGQTYVQIGNNSYKFNRHLDILDRIKHFNEENIRVIIPLNYGNDYKNIEANYPKKVTDKATALFGTKAECLKRLVPVEKYNTLLCNVDVAIHGSARQNALGNLLRSLYMGNKVYLSKDNPMYEYFLSQGIKVYRMEDINEEMSFEEFIDKEDNSEATEWIRKTFYPDSNVFYWKRMFDYFKTGSLHDLEVEEQNKALSVAFPDEVHEQLYKKNYISLEKYTILPKGTIYNNIREVYILGAGNLAITAYNTIKRNPNVKNLLLVEGFADDKTDTLDGWVSGCDVVCRPEDIEGGYIINIIEDAEYRKRITKYIDEHFDQEQCLISNSGISCVKARVGIGTYISHNVRRSPVSSIGKGVLIYDGVYIGPYAEIHDFSIIKTDVAIYENVVIGEDCIIGTGSLITSNVKLEPGTVIPSFSVVRQNEDGELIISSKY